MRGIELTVPVTSLNAYNFLSAGVRLPDWPITATWLSFTSFIKSFSLISTLNPLTDSNLSIVPPYVLDHDHSSLQLEHLLPLLMGQERVSLYHRRPL